MITTLRQKLVCPYCKSKQEYAARDYFTPDAVIGSISSENQCDNCDERFNAIILGNGMVKTYSNLTSTPPRVQKGTTNEMDGRS